MYQQTAPEVTCRISLDAWAAPHINAISISPGPKRLMVCSKLPQSMDMINVN